MLATLFVPVTQAADQWWDTSTTAGLQGGTNSWDAGPTLTWSPINSGTTTPTVWTNGNNAWFTTAGTATVNGATAGWIMTHGYNTWLPGSAPLTLNNGLTSFTSTAPHGGTYANGNPSAGPYYFFSDINLGGNVAIHDYFNVIVTGRVSGAYTVTKCYGTMTLSNSANSFPGLVIEGGGVNAYGGSNVLGGGWLTIGGGGQAYELGGFSQSSLTLQPAPAGMAWTTTVTTVTAAGGGVINLSGTNMLSAGPLVRSGLGTLAFSGSPYGGARQILFSAGTNLVNGALPPWLTDCSMSVNLGPQDFVTYTPTGVVVVVYSNSFNPSLTNQFVNISGNTALVSNQTCYALKVGTSGTIALDLNNKNLTLGNGTYAGLTLNNGAAITNGTLNFGSAELLMPMNGPGTIGVPMNGTGPLTVSARQLHALTISNSTLYAGGPITCWPPANLTLQPTADVTMSNSVYVGNSSVFTKNGPYALTLAGSTYLGNSGTFQVNGGQVVFSGAQSTNGGILYLTGNAITVTLTNGAQVIGPTANGYVGNGAGNVGDNVIVNSGSVLGSPNNSSIWVVGAATNAASNSISVSDGGKFYAGNVTIGYTANSSNNSYLVGGSGAPSTVSNATVTIGNNSTFFNTMTITNATMYASGTSYIGSTSASNNTLSILSGGTLNFAPSSTFRIGGGAAASFNAATVNGGVLYGGSITVGGAAGCVSNRLDVSNGTILIPTPGLGSFQIGSASATGNVATMVNSTMTAAGGGIGMGIGGSGACSNTLFVDNCMLTNFSTLTLAGNGSTLTLTNNAKLFVTTSPSSAASYIGSAITDSNNTVYVLAGCLYSELAGSGNQHGISHVGGFNNRLVINGGTYVDVTLVGMAGSFSGVTLTNGLFTAPGLYVGYSPSSAGAAPFGSNDFFNIFSGGIANLLNQPLAVGYNTGMVNSVSINGGIFTNVGVVNVGNYAVACSNSITITNGSVISAGAVSIGAAVGANTNYVMISGASGLWTVGGQTFTIGAASSTGNFVTITQGGTVDNIGTLTVVTNHFLNLLGGTLGMSNTVYTNGLFMVGDGTQSAKLKNLGGTNAFNGGLLIASNASLSGIGNVHGGSVGLTLTNGATIDPGLNGIGQLNVGAGILNWCGGCRYLVNVSDFQSSPGVGWDLLNVNTQINLVAGGPALTVKLDSMGVNAANFSTNSDYNLRIATASSNLVGFSGVTFTIDTSSFSNTFTGTWGITNIGTSLYITCRGSTSSSADYTWVSPNNGNWSAGGNWALSSAPAIGGNSSWVIKFPAGSADAAYYASNDLAGTFQMNQLQLASSSAVTNRILGNKLQFQNAGAGLNQLGGAFTISNPVDLATSTRFWGSGLGTVTLASNVTGAGSLTKEGSWTLALGNSNNFTGPVVVNSADGQLRLDNANALGNSSFAVSNGTLLANFGANTFGNSPVARTALVTGSGAMWTNANNTVTIGTNAVVIVASTGTLAVVGQTLTVAGKGTVPANLIVTNGGKVVTSTTAYIGNATSNETVILTGGGIWSEPGQTVTVGYGNAAGNVLRLEGGSATVNGSINVGDNTGGGTASGNGLLVSGSGSYTVGTVNLGNNTYTGSNNVMRIDNGATCTAGAITAGQNNTPNCTLLVTNGSSLIGGGSVTVGNGNTTNDAYIIDGSPGYSFVSNGTISVGTGFSTNSRMTVVNATVKSTGLTIGAANVSTIGSSVTINSNVYWDALAGTLTMGTVASLSINPTSTLTNLGGITIQGASTTLTLTNGNVFFNLTGLAENLIVGNTANLGANSLTLARIQVKSANSGTSYSGNGSASNAMSLLPNTTWNGGGNSILIVGNGAAATGNVLRLNGQGIVGGVLVTNFNIITVGTNAGVGNVMTVDGGGVSSGAVAHATSLNVGGAASQQSSLIVTNGGMVVTPTLVLGANATNSTLLVTGSNSFLNAGVMLMGSNSVGNVFTMNGAGSTATVGRLVATNSGAFNFYAGVLSLTNSFVTNGTDFVVGDGAQAATLNVAPGGTNSFSGNLVVSSNATLAGGGGMIQGTTTVYGTLSPGPLTVGLITNIAGVITNAGPFSLMPGSSTRIDMVSTNVASGWDTLVVTNGNLTLAGTLTVVVTPGLALSNQTFVIMNNAGGTVGNSFASGGTAQAYNSTNLLRSIGTFNVAVSNNQYVVLNGYSMTIARRGGMIIIR